MCIGSDFRMSTEVHISFYIGSRFENSTFFKVDIPFYSHIVFYSSTIIYRFGILSDDLIICSQEIPWVAEGDPSTLRFYNRVAPMLYVYLYEIGDLELTSLAERDVAKERKYRTIELMYSDIRKISERDIGRFLYYSFRLSILPTSEYPKILWSIDHFHERSIPLCSCEFQDICRLI